VVTSLTSFWTRPLRPWKAKPFSRSLWPRWRRVSCWPVTTCSSVRKFSLTTPPRSAWTSHFWSGSTITTRKIIRAKFCSAKTIDHTRPSSTTLRSCSTIRCVQRTNIYFDRKWYHFKATFINNNCPFHQTFTYSSVFQPVCRDYHLGLLFYTCASSSKRLWAIDLIIHMLNIPFL